MAQNTRTHALYIHWPFCRKKCPYCDFNSHVRETVDEPAWHHALLAELNWYADQADTRPISSIFFGGGTPSLMPPTIAEALINQAEKHFGFTHDCEITLEANPTSAEMAKLSDLRQAGVNRLSLGVQSLDDNALAFLGREHSAAEAMQAFDSVGKLFDRYSFDLIYALPDQTLLEWEQELKRGLNHAGDHLSLYQLTIEQGTQFYHHHQSGKLVMPEESLLADFYDLTQSIMDAHQMPAYEISNHAKVAQKARHNVHIWRGGSYLGIGPGAHGRMETANGDRHATYNLRSPEAWLEAVKSGGHGNEIMRNLPQDERREERILMGLRLREGLRLSPENWPATYLEALVNEGLIHTNPSRIIPTAQGRMVLNSLTAGLVEHLS